MWGQLRYEINPRLDFKRLLGDFILVSLNCNADYLSSGGGLCLTKQRITH